MPRRRHPLCQSVIPDSLPVLFARLLVCGVGYCWEWERRCIFCCMQLHSVKAHAVLVSFWISGREGLVQSETFLGLQWAGPQRSCAEWEWPGALCPGAWELSVWTAVHTWLSGVGQPRSESGRALGCGSTSRAQGHYHLGGETLVLMGGL